MAITKIHAVKVRLGDAINYIENPDKTDGQELISGYNTAPQTAVLDFSVTAAMARKARNTSAKKQGNLAYHMIQSFSPDDAVTPELAHKLGRKLAMEFTDGKFEFVVATHSNKEGRKRPSPLHYAIKNCVLHQAIDKRYLRRCIC